MRRRTRRVAVAGLALSCIGPAALAQIIGDLQKPEVYEDWMVLPDLGETELPVEGALRLHLAHRECTRWGGRIESCAPRKPAKRGLIVTWTVNGEVAGGPDIGWVRTFKDRFNTGGDIDTGIDVDDVVYTAPAKVPIQPPGRFTMRWAHAVASMAAFLLVSTSRLVLVPKMGSHGAEDRR